MQNINIVTNKSKIYFTPLFNTEVEISHFNKLQNTYFWQNDFKEEVFCLLYEFSGKVTGSFTTRDGFTVYEKRVLMNNKLFKSYEDYGKYVLYKYELTDELFDYRNLLLEGKYSKLPERAKKLILDFSLKQYGSNDKDYIEKVLNADISLRKDIANKYNVDLEFVKEASGLIVPENELFINSLIKREEK